jgi:membrane protease YdiL (CAAX protease family)
LALYLTAVVIVAVAIAPLLFWSAQSLVAHGLFSFLVKYDFETYFHRAVLIAAAVLLWPFLRVSGVRRIADLDLKSNTHWGRNLLAGVVFSMVPLLCCGALLVGFHVYSLRHIFVWSRLGKLILAAITVPLIEEAFFRGIILGVLLKSGRKYPAIVAVSALFAIVHFLKAPDRTSATVTWISGFNSISHAFAQFGNPIMLLSAFATLFLIGCILADARVLTRSLWLSIGLHAGWILGSGVFSLISRQRMLALPWLGKNLLVGVVPLGVATITWILMRAWLRHDPSSKA